MPSAGRNPPRSPSRSAFCQSPLKTPHGPGLAAGAEGVAVASEAWARRGAGRAPPRQRKGRGGPEGKRTRPPPVSRWPEASRRCPASHPPPGRPPRRWRGTPRRIPGKAPPLLAKPKRGERQTSVVVTRTPRTPGSAGRAGGAQAKSIRFRDSPPAKPSDDSPRTMENSRPLRSGSIAARRRVDQVEPTHAASPAGDFGDHQPILRSSVPGCARRCLGRAAGLRREGAAIERVEADEAAERRPKLRTGARRSGAVGLRGQPGAPPPRPSWNAPDRDASHAAAAMTEGRQRRTGRPTATRSDVHRRRMLRGEGAAPARRPIAGETEAGETRKQHRPGRGFGNRSRASRLRRDDDWRAAVHGVLKVQGDRGVDLQIGAGPGVSRCAAGRQTGASRDHDRIGPDRRLETCRSSRRP